MKKVTKKIVDKPLAVLALPANLIFSPEPFLSLAEEPVEAVSIGTSIMPHGFMTETGLSPTQSSCSTSLFL